LYDNIVFYVFGK